MANLSLVFDLIGRDVSASKSFKDVGDAADRAGKSGENFGSLVSKGLKLAGGALLGAGLIEGFKSLYDAAAESAKIGRLTEQVIKSTGGAAKITASQVGDLATALSKKTGVDDEVIQSGANLLLTFTNVRNEVGKGNDIFNQATATITDMSVALGQDTSSSAIQLGKALNDPIKGVTALQRVGVSFTASQKEQISTLVESGKTLDAQKLILSELGKEFGGAAAAASTPLDKLKVNLGNLAETLGSNLIPYVNDFSDFLSNKVLPAVTDVGGVVSGTLGPALRLAVDLFKGLFDTLGSVVHWFSDLPAPLKLAVESLAAMAALKGPLGSLFDTLRDTAQTAALRALYLKDSLGSIGGAAGLAKAGAGGLVSFFGGPWGLALTGATVGISLLTAWLGKSNEATKATKQATQDYADALRSANGVINESVRQAAAKAAQDAGLLDVAHKLGISLPTVTSAITDQGAALDSTRSRLQEYIEKHTEVTRRGSQYLDEEGQSAKNALDALNKLSGQTGTTTSDQRQLAEATGKVAAGMGTASSSAQQLMADLKDTSDAAGEARQQTDLFKTSLDILTGKNVDLLQVQAQLQDALAAGKDAMDKQGGAVLDAAGALNVQSENGRKASNVLLDIRNSGNELISTMIQQGATSDQVQAKDAELRASFINTAKQMGISQDAANHLADQILGIPAERTTTINADTGPANAALEQLKADLAKMGAVATVQFNTANARDGFAARRAMGGPIFGPGTGTSDSIPALLSNGEHVITAREVQAAGGHTAVEAWRKSLVQGYAAGGPIAGYEIPVGLAQSTLSSLRAKLTPTFTGGGGGAGSPLIRALGQNIAAAMGFGPQFSAIDYIFSHESGWNPNAQNPTSTAFGIPQFLNATWAAYGGKTSDPARQITDGIRYMVDRYGSPAQAANFWAAHHWYENGTNYVPSDQLAVLHKGEAVVPASQNQGAPWQGGGPAVFHLYDADGVLMGTMRGHAETAVSGAVTGLTRTMSARGV